MPQSSAPPTLFSVQSLPLVPRNPRDWYRERGYTHFDWPLSRDAAEPIVSRAASVASHAFLPFIRFSIVEPRYNPDEHRVVPKKRDVAFAAHRDAHVFAYYAHTLYRAYEARLAASGISDSVLAYRRFSSSACNVDFAADVFRRIATMAPCAAVAVDLESFFDTIDHSALKNAWASILGTGKRLPDDHFAVYSAVTRYAWMGG